jgi:hypothetical protein
VCEGFLTRPQGDDLQTHPAGHDGICGPDKASPERTLLPSDCHASRPSAEEYEEWSGAQLKGYVDEIGASGSMSREAAEEQGRHSGSDDRRITDAEGKEPHATSGSTR